MMIRQDFEEFPPRAFMMQILDNLARIYVFLWDKKDKFNRLKLEWREISKYYQKNCFRTNLRKLNNHGLLSYVENGDIISIELVGWDNFMEE